MLIFRSRQSCPGYWYRGQTDAFPDNQYCLWSDFLSARLIAADGNMFAQHFVKHSAALVMVGSAPQNPKPQHGMKPALCIKRRLEIHEWAGLVPHLCIEIDGNIVAALREQRGAIIAPLRNIKNISLIQRNTAISQFIFAFTGNFEHEAVTEARRTDQLSGRCTFPYWQDLQFFHISNINITIFTLSKKLPKHNRNQIFSEQSSNISPYPGT